MANKQKSKKSFSWLGDVTKIFSSVIDKIVENSDQKIEEIKRKAVNYIIVYGFFMLALFFVLVGFVKYLAEIYFFSSEGIAFMFIGSVMIVIAAAYSMIKRV